MCVRGRGGVFFVEAVEDFCGVRLREVELVGFTGGEVNLKKPVSHGVATFVLSIERVAARG